MVFIKMEKHREPDLILRMKYERQINKYYEQ